VGRKLCGPDAVRRSDATQECAIGLTFAVRDGRSGVGLRSFATWYHVRRLRLDSVVRFSSHVISLLIQQGLIVRVGTDYYARRQLKTLLFGAAARSVAALGSRGFLFDEVKGGVFAHADDAFAYPFNSGATWGHTAYTIMNDLRIHSPEARRTGEAYRA
jgi:hypothetical protein